MDINMICATWIKKEDEKVLEILRKSDRWLSAEELSAATGLPVYRVKQTLSLMNQQRGFYSSRQFLKRHGFFD